MGSIGHNSLVGGLAAELIVSSTATILTRLYVSNMSSAASLVEDDAEAETREGCHGR